MSPVLLELSQDYTALLDKLLLEMKRFNPQQKIISRTHILRYAIRLASGEPRGLKTVSKVLITEDKRGRSRRSDSPEVPVRKTRK